jgi:Mg2+-importing ATPase
VHNRTFLPFYLQAQSMGRERMGQQPPPFWSLSSNELFRQLQSRKEGLTDDEACDRLARYGSNLLKPPKRSDAFALLLSQFKSPLALILFFATGLSFFLGNAVDATIILVIVLASGVLGFWQERGASNAVESLLSIFPVEKAVGVLSAQMPLGQRTNSLWMGTHVVTGSGKALIVSTGKTTECGKLSERLKLRPQETDFERGIRHFGYFLMEVTLVLVVAILPSMSFWRGRFWIPSSFRWRSP